MRIVYDLPHSPERKRTGFGRLDEFGFRNASASSNALERFEHPSTIFHDHAGVREETRIFQRLADRRTGLSWNHAHRFWRAAGTLART
jgi:hypothetical protein